MRYVFVREVRHAIRVQGRANPQQSRSEPRTVTCSTCTSMQRARGFTPLRLGLHAS